MKLFTTTSLGVCCAAAAALAVGQTATAQVNVGQKTRVNAQAGQRLETVGKGRITTSVNGKRSNFTVNENTKVRLNGRPARLGDLRAGDDLRVTTSRDGKRAIAIEGTRRTSARVTNRRNVDANSRVRLGVHLQESPTTGVYITETLRGGPAANAGIRSGDYILSVAGTDIDSPRAFRQAMGNLKHGQRAKVVVWRNNRKETLNVRLPKEAMVRNNAQLNGNINGNAQTRAWLGIQMTPATRGQKGVRVANVYPSGPAAFADLEAGDQLISVNGQAVKSPGQLSTRIAAMKPNDQVKLVVMRDGQQQTLNATLGNASDYIDVSQLNGAPQSANGVQGDYYGEPSGHAMMLQQHHHMAKQHERIEKLVLELKQEIQELRKELKARNGQ